MTEAKKYDDGGPAFATAENGDFKNAWHQEGMTLADWFAGQALVSMINDPAMRDDESLAWSDYARESYNFADAMIAEKRRREAGQ